MMQFVSLLNEMTTIGTEQFAKFLNTATSAEATRAGKWMNSASSAQVKEAAALLNEGKLDEFRQFIGIRQGFWSSLFGKRKSETPSISVKESVQDDDPNAPIRFVCECKKKLRVEASLAGKKVKCPACGRSSLVPSRSAAPQAEEQPPRFLEQDNRGTRHDTLEKASSYWFARLGSSRKDPFAVYTFDREAEAKEALLELPCIHVAEDTQNLICTAVLIFGVYPTENQNFEAVICGDDLSVELWEQTKSSFEKHGGRRKGDLQPEKRAPSQQSTPNTGGGKVVFEREEHHQQMGVVMTYRIHTAPDADTAQNWLQQNPVTKKHSYLVVQTPQGNYCRDIDGMYKE